jgi:ABC-type branched-subunit amino acid transport system ATPase component
MRLKAQDLTFAVSRSWRLLDSLSLDVPAGALVGVCGENGCGKTTLLQVLAGLVHPQSGTVHLQRTESVPSADVTRWPLWRRAQSGMAYVPQENRVWPEMTVEEHLRMVANGSAADAAIGRDIVTVLPPAARAATLSHGQQRYLLLMRALAMSPTLLLADEPMAGLDKELQARSVEIVRNLVAGGMSGVIVEHDRAALESLGARVFVLKEGGLHAL